MTLDVKNSYSVVRHKDKLFTVLDYPRNLGNVAKEGSMRTTHWAAYYFTNPNSWYPVPERVVDPLGHTIHFNHYHLCRWHTRAYRRLGTGRKHLLQQCVSSLSNRKQRWLWLRGAARKQQETRRRGRWNIGVRFLEWWWWHSTFGTRGWFLPRERFLLRKKYSLQQQNCVQLIFFYLLCYGYMGLPWPFVFYALVEIVIRFFDTDCLYLYVCPWSKFDERKSLPWLAYVIPARRCKLLIWMISSFWWKLLQRKQKTRKQEETLMPDSDHRLQRINAG